MTAVSDTSVLIYVFLIGEWRLLPALYDPVLIPEAVWEELHHPGAPELVRRRLTDQVDWLDVEAASCSAPFSSITGLHRGETEAILLPERHHASLVLLDDLRARQFAADRGLKVAGTLRVLADAALQRQVDPADAFARLR